MRIHYNHNSASAELMLGQDWKVRPTDELLGCLSELVGNDSVHVLYH